MRMFVKYALLFVCIIISACSLKKTVTTMTAKMLDDGMRAVESESDLWIAKESIVPMVKTLEILKEGDHENVLFLGLMAKVYGNVAFGFFEPRYMTAPEKEKQIWRERIERYYKSGFEAGLKSMEGRFGKNVSGSIQDFAKVMKKAGKKDIQVLFWTAFDLANWVNLKKDDIASVALLPKAEMMIDRVLEVDRDFGYGSALALKAAMMASRPTMLGGNPEKAKEFFEEAIKVNDGKYLMTKVMYAEWYARPQKNVTLSNELLSAVLNSDPNALPEQALANHLARERSGMLRQL